MLKVSAITNSLLICYLASQGRWKYEESIDLNLIQTNVTVDKWVGMVIAS